MKQKIKQAFIAFSFIAAISCSSESSPVYSDYDIFYQNGDVEVNNVDVNGDIDNTNKDNLPAADIDTSTVPEKDSDGDGISDKVEIGNDPSNPIDTDKDGKPDYLDDDSDNDGIKDIDEAAASPDPDGDGIPNHLDPDSDNDGLPDKQEKMCGDKHSAYIKDIDGDGFSDLAEAAVDSDLCDKTNGVTDMPGINFYFELPYDGPTKTDTLVFTPKVKMVDVFFSMDTTGSMKGAITNLKNSLSSTGGIIDQVKNRVTSAAFGVGDWRDWPACGLGSTGDHLFKLVQRITEKKEEAQTGVNKLVHGGGADRPEAGYSALYVIATGESMLWSSGKVEVPEYTEAGFGGAGFRRGAIPIVMHITDAQSHTKAHYDTCAQIDKSTTHTKDETIDALNSLGARVITIDAQLSYDATKVSQLNEISKKTGAIIPVCAFKTETDWRCGVDKCCTGINSGAQNPTDGNCILRYQVPSTGVGLGNSVVDGVDAVIKYATFEIFAKPVDDGDLSTVDTSCFIKKIEAQKFIPPGAEPEFSCTPVAVPAMLNGETTYNNGFTNFSAGTSSADKEGSTLEFMVNAQNNKCFTPEKTPKVFEASIQIIDQATKSILDIQKVTIIVPPYIAIEPEEEE